jgi:tRNA(adenine34) deaminase
MVGDQQAHAPKGTGRGAGPGCEDDRVSTLTPGPPAGEGPNGGPRFGAPGATPAPEGVGERALDPPDAGQLSELMGQALAEAAACRRTGDVPVGALVVDPAGEVIARGRNEREHRQDPTAHAELIALRGAAAALGTWRLTGCTLVVTLEPCAMCAGALVLARVSRLVLAAWDTKAGAAGSTRDIVRDSRLNHRLDVVGGIRGPESAALLRTFFSARRGPS